MELIIINDPGKQWDDFIKKYSSLTYHQSRWANVIKDGFNSEILYFMLEDKARIVAALPGFIMRKIFIKMYFSSIPFGGFIGDEKYFSCFKEKIEEYLKKRGVHQVRISDSLVYKGRELNDYKKQEMARIILDLVKFRKKGGAGSLHKVIRKRIKKGTELGVKIDKIKERNEVEDFYHLYIESMKRQKALAKYSKKYIYAVYDHIIPLGRAEIIFASYKNVKIAGMVVIYSGKYAHLLFSGFLHTERYLRASDILIEHLINNKKIDYFDFMCCLKNDKGLVSFKEKWGSDTTEFRFHSKDLFKPVCLLWKMFYCMAGTGTGRWLLRKIRK